jgi:tripartite-type tricarboxylate transporter receptor subunit TctC
MVIEHRFVEAIVMRIPVTIIALIGVSQLIPCPAIGQNYPSKTVRVVVPFAPGGSADILARSVSQKIGEALGQSFVIDNRGGGGGIIGTEMVAKSPPDGYTILFTTNGPVTVSPSLQRKIGYDTRNDLMPVTIVASLPSLLVMHPSLPVNSVKDVVALAKRQPGQITYASGGPGASNHLAAELFNYLAKINLLHVPYKGGGPAAIAVLSGECALLFGTMPSTLGHVHAKRLKALAVTSEKRSPAAPMVPTIAESGVPGYEMTSWVGILLPAGTAANVGRTLHRETEKAVQSTSVRDRLVNEGYETVMNSPEQMAQRMQVEADKWAKVIKAARISAD